MVEHVLNCYDFGAVGDLDSLMACDQHARMLAKQLIVEGLATL